MPGIREVCAGDGRRNAARFGALVVISFVVCGCQAGGQSGGEMAARPVAYAPPPMTANPNPQMAADATDDIPEDMDYETAKRLADRAMQRNACIQQGRAALRQAEATSQAGGYAAAAAGAAGPGGKVASKAIGVGTAHAVHGQVQAIAANPC